jgi:hypothetical protein
LKDACQYSVKCCCGGSWSQREEDPAVRCGGLDGVLVLFLLRRCGGGVAWRWRRVAGAQSVPPVALLSVRLCRCVGVVPVST